MLTLQNSTLHIIKYGTIYIRHYGQPEGMMGIEEKFEQAIPSELLFRWKWWFDPVPFPYFERLDLGIQREIVAVSLQTQAEMLKVQADGMRKLSEVVQRGK